MVLQVCHNYFISRVDHLVLDMEESSTELVDHLVAIKTKK